MPWGCYFDSWPHISSQNEVTARKQAGSHWLKKKNTWKKISSFIYRVLCKHYDRMPRQIQRILFEVASPKQLKGRRTLFITMGKALWLEFHLPWQKLVWTACYIGGSESRILGCSHGHYLLGSTLPIVLHNPTMLHIPQPTKMAPPAKRQVFKPISLWRALYIQLDVK